MSRENPRFGEVFEFRSDSGKIKVMYLGPAQDDQREFMGICVNRTRGMLASIGEVADYLPLIDAFENEPGWGKWFEVDDDGE